jgi:uncharacterized protein (DUF58 family)
MMAGPLLISFVLLSRALRNLEITRRLPEGICAGDRLVVRLVAASHKRWLGNWGVVAEDTIEQVRDGQVGDKLKVGVVFPRVPAGQNTEASYEGRLMTRGLYRFGPLRVSTRFPLGLFRQAGVIRTPQSLVVAPRLGRLTRDWLLKQREDESGAKQMEHRQGLAEGDFYGLRDWRNGDSRRWIHWRSTARRGHLVVRQFEQRRNQDLLLLVDLWQPRAASDADADNLELAVSFAATVLADACRRGGNRLQVVIGGRKVVSRAAWASPVFLQELMEVLALAEPHAGDVPAADLLATLSEAKTSAQAVWVTTRATPAESLGRALANRGGVTVGLRRLRIVETGAEDFARYFEIS